MFSKVFFVSVKREESRVAVNHVKRILVTCLQHSESLYDVREHEGCLVLKRYLREYKLVLQWVVV